MTKKDLHRAEFIKMTGGLAFLVLGNKWSFTESSLPSDLVASAQKRHEYTISLLKQLVTDIGPRPSGSKAYAKAAKIVLKEMRRSPPQVNYDRYEFEEWGPVSSSDLIVGAQHIGAIPQKRGFGTPAEGLREIVPL